MKCSCLDLDWKPHPLLPWSWSPSGGMLCGFDSSPVPPRRPSETGSCLSSGSYGCRGYARGSAFLEIIGHGDRFCCDCDRR